MRVYEYLQGILGALGVGDDNGVPTPAWRIEEYLEAIYEAIKAGGGGGGGTDLTTFLAPQFSSSTSYSAGDYVVKSGALYKFTEDHAAGAWTGTDVEQTLTATELEALYAALANKANVDGSYSSLTAGNAEQLVSTVGVEDKTPYLFRTTGGSADVGDRVKLSEITGGTVAFNQLVQNGNFASTTGWTAGTIKDGTVTNNILSATATAQNQFVANLFLQSGKPIVGHKMLYTMQVKADSNLVKLFCQGTGTTQPHSGDGKFNTLSRIIEVTTTADKYIGVLDARSSDWTEFQMKNAMVFDLTQMFGSTIADYIYTLEQNTAGAGVAWFRKLFPKDYYAYDAGSLLSVKTSAHKEVGFNQWDEEWEVGDLDNGLNHANATRFRSKNYIPVLPNTSYYFHKENTTGLYLLVSYYDASKNFLAEESVNAWGKTLSWNTASTIPSTAYYIRFFVTGTTVYTNDICINLHWDGERDGEYEPYEEHSYALDSDLELRGIPKLDANNNLYYDGDTYAPDGTVTRRYEIIDLGVQNWTLSSGGANIFTFPLSDRKYSSDIKAICSRYPFKGTINQAVDVPSKGDKTCCFYYQSGQSYKNFYIYDTSYSTADAFKTAMNGVYLVYELATPTTETADPFQETQICNDFGTEEFVDSRTVPMPVGASALYQANLRAKLEMAPDSPDGDGDYIVRQTDGENTYVPLVIPTELPTNPSTDGTYSLKVTIVNGVATLSWVADA